MTSEPAKSVTVVRVTPSIELMRCSTRDMLEALYKENPLERPGATKPKRGRPPKPKPVKVKRDPAALRRADTEGERYADVERRAKKLVEYWASKGGTVKCQIVEVMPDSNRYVLRTDMVGGIPRDAKGPRVKDGPKFTRFGSGTVNG